MTAGSTSVRTSPSCSAARTSPVTMRSNSRRRCSAVRSTSVLPRSRSSRVTNGSSAASTRTEPRTTCSSRSIAGPVVAPGLLGDGEQRVQRPVERQPQQLDLAGHVVVDRRLGDAEPGGHLVHAGRLVAALVEQRDRGVEQRVQRVPGAARAGPGTRFGVDASSLVRSPVVGQPLQLAHRPRQRVRVDDEHLDARADGVLDPLRPPRPRPARGARPGSRAGPRPAHGQVVHPAAGGQHQVGSAATAPACAARSPRSGSGRGSPRAG